MVRVLRRCPLILSVRTALYLIPSLLWLVRIHVELRNCPVSDAKTFGLLPLCIVVYHLIFPWLKSTIIIQSPLLTSLIALCIVSLFCLVMLGQRYTNPMVTAVCPVTNLHACVTNLHACVTKKLGLGPL